MSNIFFIIAAVIILIARASNSKDKKVKNTQRVDTDINIDDISSDAIDNIKSTAPLPPPHTVIPDDGYPAAVVKQSTPAAKPKNSAKKTKNTPKTASNEVDEDRFDLEKAVIYSEILTPKFKSEDIY